MRMQRKIQWQRSQQQQSTNQKESPIKNSSSYRSSDNSVYIGGEGHSLSANGKNITQYERIQENVRIVRRIINPKRDKIIMRSIESVKTRRKMVRHEVRAKSEHHWRGRGFAQDSRVDKAASLLTCDGYDLKIQNQRMGMRIINVKSIVRTAGTKTRLGAKINKGVQAFFRYESEDEHFSSQQLKRDLAAMNLKPYYGYGPTILSLNWINIDVIPQLKPTDLLYLELMVKQCSPKPYQTSILPYSALKQGKIKFALRLKKVGQFVPLRFWKVNGVQNIQIGIVDINFVRYMHQQMWGQPMADETLPFQNDLQMPKQRVIVRDKIQSKFRRTKKQEARGTVQIQYSIYRKRYH